MTHHLTIQHVHGHFFCAGHHGDLREVVTRLREIYHGNTRVEVIDVPTNRVLVGADDPWPGVLPGTPQVQEPQPDYAAGERAALQALKRNWGLKPIIIATLLALGFAVWVFAAFPPAGPSLPRLVEDGPGGTPLFIPGISGTGRTYGPMKGDERNAQGGENEIRKMEQARQELERLPKGKIVLDAPKAMKVGDIRAVYANVGINVPIEVLRRHSRPTDQSHEGVLSVSREMGAALTGPGFTITPTTPEQQGVAEGFPTVWSWNVEAKQEGEQELEATLYVLLPVGDKSTRQRIDSYTHKVGVSIKEQSWAEWLKSSKEEVEAVHVIAITLGSVVMAVLGWLGLSYGRRRQIENRNQTEAT